MLLLLKTKKKIIMANHYDIPSWYLFILNNKYKKFNYVYCRAGKPTTGLHLDVTKDGKLIQVTRPRHIALLLPSPA